MKAGTFRFAVCCIGLATMCSVSLAQKNSNGRWALHYAGPHNMKSNTCDFEVYDCYGDIDTEAPVGPGNFDIYIIAVNVDGIAGTRYGLYGQGYFYFYEGSEWRNCADLEISTDHWPGCGEGIAVTWASEQSGPNVTLGVMHVYAYGAGEIWLGPDPRVGYAEFCDGTEPEPDCMQTDWAPLFGSIGFGVYGYNVCWIDASAAGTRPPRFDMGIYGLCGAVPVEHRTWGGIKALYK